MRSRRAEPPQYAVRCRQCALRKTRACLAVASGPYNKRASRRRRVRGDSNSYTGRRSGAGVGTRVTEPARRVRERAQKDNGAFTNAPSSKNGAGNGIRTRDFDLGKVALYH